MASSRTAQKTKYSWTQPCCPDCWNSLKLKTGRADPSITSVAFCCFCKRQIGRAETIYMLRINPGTVPYPTIKKEEEE